MIPPTTAAAVATPTIPITATTATANSSPNIECLLCLISHSVDFGYINSLNSQMIVIATVLVTHFTDKVIGTQVH